VFEHCHCCYNAAAVSWASPVSQEAKVLPDLLVTLAYQVQLDSLDQMVSKASLVREALRV